MKKNWIFNKKKLSSQKLDIPDTVLHEVLNSVFSQSNRTNYVHSFVDIFDDILAELKLHLSKNRRNFIVQFSWIILKVLAH